MIKYNVNVCDRIYNEMMIHFTQVCPNDCKFCIDKCNVGVNSKTPDVKSIEKSIEKYKNDITQVTISGGEPFLFVDELKELVTWIRNNTSLKIYIVTAIPKTCYDRYVDFCEICDIVDGLQFSVQHYDENVAEQIRNVKNSFDRQEIYRNFQFKEKVTISLNVLKPWLCEKEDIIKSIMHYYYLGYDNIKLAEMFDADEYYVDIPKVLGIHMKSPYAHGCKVEYDTSELIPDFFGKLTIKRTCFLRTKCQKASLSDFFKTVTKYVKKKKYFFGVIHEDGTVAPYWI